MRRPSCSSPRACTSNDSPPPGSAMTRSETLVEASAMSRSPILLPVIWLPSRPASGESLGLNTILRSAIETLPQHIGHTDTVGITRWVSARDMRQNLG